MTISLFVGKRLSLGSKSVSHEESNRGGYAPPPIGSGTPTSTILQNLLLHAPDETVTLGWLMGHLGRRSFGIILLLLGLLACLPGVSAVAGVLIAIPAYQMIIARTGPVFPRVLHRQPSRSGDSPPS